MQRPITKRLNDTGKYSDCTEYVDCKFEASLRCKICGYIPERFGTFGCIEGMENHLKVEHGILPDKVYFWLDPPTESDIIEGLKLLYSMRGR